MDILERIKEMERQLAALKAEVAQEAETEQWEPEGGDWYVGYDGSVRKSPTALKARVFGFERKTKEQAEKAAAAMRTHNRLLAYIAEFAQDWEPDLSDIGQIKCLVYFDNHQKKWFYARVFSDIYTGTVLMPRGVAKELCRKLNSGEVVL